MSINWPPMINQDEEYMKLREVLTALMQVERLVGHYTGQNFERVFAKTGVGVKWHEDAPAIVGYDYDLARSMGYEEFDHINNFIEHEVDTQWAFTAEELATNFIDYKNLENFVEGR